MGPAGLGRAAEMDPAKVNAGFRAGVIPGMGIYVPKIGMLG